MGKDRLNAAIGIIILIFFFILASYLVQTNLGYIENLIGKSSISMFIFVLILIIATVIAPINAVPLLPVASNVWGWFITGILSVIGWGIGSLIAFSLARRYGVPLVRKFFSLKNIAKYEKLIPEENIFWSIVFLRVSIPVDILSYVLGLFSHIKFRTYALATIIGIAPMAFVISYVGTLQIRFQIITFFAAVVIILAGYLINKKYRQRKLLKKKNLENINDK